MEEWNTPAMAHKATYVPGVIRVSERVTAYECGDYIQDFKTFSVLRALAYSVSNSSYI